MRLSIPSFMYVLEDIYEDHFQVDSENFQLFFHIERKQFLLIRFTVHKYKCILSRTE